MTQKEVLEKCLRVLRQFKNNRSLLIEDRREIANLINDIEEVLKLPKSSPHIIS